MATVTNLIYSALRLCGQLKGPGRTASPEELADGLAVLNVMLDSWATERLIVYNIKRKVWNLVATQSVYHIGPGAADWDTLAEPRPTRIERASVLYNADPANPMEIPIGVVGFREWQNTPLKTTQSDIVQQIYYDGEFPVAHVNVYPVPSVATHQIVLYTWGAVSQFTSLTENVQLPPGYQRAVETALAIELSPRFPGSRLNPLVIQQAIESKASIKRLNMQTTISRCDSALVKCGGSFNVYTGDYRK